MSIRLVVTFAAAPGKAAEYLAAWKERCAAVTGEEPGCEQYEIFQSAEDPDRLVLVEHWTDQAALDAHFEHSKTRPPMPAELGAFVSREDYVYNRVR